MKIEIQEFFKLPLDEKMVFSKIPDDSEGYGQGLGRVSEDDMLDWNNRLYLVALFVSLRNMRLWLTNPPSFRESFKKYLMVLHEVMI
ncbi:hypothetical protein F3Y22_tig00112400pilonHSYRG00009 [Hibiscus syriacus]|uniref:Non-haem dioxygenase N-terminal domain-containing protein n=1 Tax=Hibiscus syriacus TaxID=106335 RepID=A0A6A2XKC5_HIBSY|nr:hypothetical protein F3Y22_tig00112400pilonHSYRG00009 [Hibiscus syriacus]